MITGEVVQRLDGVGVILLGVVCEDRTRASREQVWVGIRLWGAVS